MNYQLSLLTFSWVFQNHNLKSNSTKYQIFYKMNGVFLSWWYTKPHNRSIKTGSESQKSLITNLKRWSLTILVSSYSCCIWTFISHLGSKFKRLALSKYTKTSLLKLEIKLWEVSRLSSILRLSKIWKHKINYGIVTVRTTIFMGFLASMRFYVHWLLRHHFSEN